MAKKKKKPSKRGKKAYKISLHCSPMIVTQEKKIKKLAKWIKAIAEFIKALIQLSNVMTVSYTHLTLPTKLEV